MKHIGIVGGTIIALILLVFGIAWVLDETRANSSSGVSEVSSGVVRIPTGETAVFYQSVGKTSREWHATFDGRSKLSFRCVTWLCGGTDVVTEVSPERISTIDFGFLERDLSATMDATGAARVILPDEFLSSWSYRAPRPAQ